LLLMHNTSSTSLELTILQLCQGRPVLPMNQDINGQLQWNFRAGCLAKIG
jgi:hypothetical protein